MARRARWIAFVTLALALALAGCGGCGKKAPAAALDADPPDAPLVTAPSATAPGAPRPRMAWIAPGVLRAGTPLDRALRIADEELPGTEIPMAGYYVDLFPYPNEPGAIPTTNVTRDEAQRLCQEKQKRLCTELEWERACKGPENTTYEYGNDYRAATCGTGVVVERAARQPTGERLACKSGFGVLETHGGVWEWTDSAWGRASKANNQGVLRGGNAAAGELVGRCANGIARPTTSKGPQYGFRCCAGPRNDAKVDLTVTTGPALARSATPAELAAPLAPLLEKAWKAPSAIVFDRAWTWRPHPNEELVVASTCQRTPKETLFCGMAIARLDGTGVHLLGEFQEGYDVPELAQHGEARRLRARGLDWQGAYVRDLVYSYGRVELSDAKR